MECPHCSKPVSLPDRAYFNADQYGKSSVVVAECCQRPIRLTPVRSYRVTAYIGERTEDDWGVKIAKVKEPTP